MADSKITPLFGTALPQADAGFAANPQIVAIFEDMLVRAKRGEIQAAVVICVEGGLATCVDHLVPKNIHARCLIAEMFCLQQSLAVAMDETAYEASPVSDEPA